MKSKIASFFNALFIDFRHFKSVSKIEKVVEKMNHSEKILFFASSIILCITSILLLVRVHNSLLVEVPSYGGSFTEGLVGSPRFINPVLAISDTDKDLSSLIYSGLIRQKVDGNFEGDIAESFSVSEDGLVYDFVIKENVYFHDNKPVTADDVIFTIQRIVDGVVKSPKHAIFEGVSVEKISQKQVRFSLKKPYAPFLTALSVGILPKHIWENASSEEFPFSEFNIDPVGSGPYKIDKISRNSGGIPTLLTLESWKRYPLGRPKIKSITFRFYPNSAELLKALKEGSVDSVSGFDPKVVREMGIEDDSKVEASLPRVFGVFLNQNLAPVFLNTEVRYALESATPKKRIVDEVLFGFGNMLNGPTPTNIEGEAGEEALKIEEAKASLSKAGWTEKEDGTLQKKTKSGTVELAFSLSTSDAPELKKTAEILKEAWGKLGAKVDIKIFEASDLSQNIIRGRKYDALLFGEVVGSDSDLYPFWHSRERNDPGLNISLYTNITVDKLLEETQKEPLREVREAKKEKIISEIKKDMPAIFLFSPQFIYIPPKNVKNITLKNISYQNERFLSIKDWYIETDRVWKIFATN